MVVKHYKGGMYTILFYAFDANNSSDREEVVVYVSHTTGGVFVRKREEFEEPVKWPDGHYRPRFLFIGKYERPERNTNAGD